MTDHHHPDATTAEAPTPKQLRYLRSLAMSTGRTFVPPTTKHEASEAIAQLKRAARSTRTERQLEQRHRPEHRLPAQTTSGYGTGARWA